MIRKHLTIALAMVVASGGAALATSAPSPSITGGPVRTVPGASACGGPGYSLITTPSTREGYVCTHTAPDLPALAGTQYAASAGIKPASAKVSCYGDGTTGPRIQVIYGYYSGQTNRSKAVVQQFQTVKAGRMQAVINAQGLGRDLGLRFAWTVGCKTIDVKTVEFPRSVQFDDDGDARTYTDQVGRIIDKLFALKFTRNDRKYLVLWDGFAPPIAPGVVACGAAQGGLPSYAGSVPGSPRSEGVPTLGGRTSPDLSSVDQAFPLDYSVVSRYAVTFRYGGRPGAVDCANGGMSTVSNQLHELFHTLGAVATDAPHADRGHCTDAPSIMCSGDVAGYGLGSAIPACYKVLVETLDCGMDDYWNPSPEAGTYLSTHLNIAKSKFFGPQPQDLLGASAL